MDITFGVVPLVNTLITYSAQVYDIYQSTKRAGQDISRLETQFEVEMQWLSNWARDRGFDSPHSVRPEPQDERKYLAALRVLAIIATILADKNSLQTKYGKIGSPSLHTSPVRGRLRLSLPAVFRSPSRSRLSLPVVFRSSSRSRSRTRSSTTPQENELYLQELSNLGLDHNSSIAEQLDILGRFAYGIQKDLSTSKKLGWGFSDRAKLEGLATQLRQWNDALDRLSLPLKAVTIAPAEYKIDFGPQYRRNPNFCGRGDVFGEINEFFWPNETNLGCYSRLLEFKVIALYGLGGIGKSHIAQEYAYQREKEYSSRLWVNADNAAEMEKSCLEIMKRIIIHYEELPEFTSFQKIANALFVFDNIDSRKQLIDAIAQSPSHFVKEWLSRGDNDRWLLLIDNYDNPDSTDLNKLFPNTCSGHVIITTRKREAAVQHKAIHVEQFAKDDGIELLRKSSKKHHLSQLEEDHASKIVELVGGLPLALDQIGAYVFVVGGSFTEYERLLIEKYDKLMFEEEGSKGSTLFATTQHRLNTVWRISFGALHDDAARLLELCSFIGNRGVQHEMLSRGKAEVDWITDDQTIDNALENLMSFSLIKREESNDRSYWIHPVVHKWARNHLISGRRSVLQQSQNSVRQTQDTGTNLRECSRLEERYSRLALYLVTSTFVLDEPKPPEEWVYELSILSHIKCCYEAMKNYTILEDDSEYGKIQTALYALARMYMRLGYVDEAHHAYTKVLNGCKSGSLDLTDLDMMGHFAKNLFLRGKYSEALQWYGRVLSGKEKILGRESLSTLDTRHNIAKVLIEQSCYDQALEEYKIVLAGQTEALGKDHLSTLETRQSIAVLHKDRGNYAEALSILEDIRSAKEKIIPDQNDPSLLNTIFLIAVVLRTKGEYTQAGLEYERVLKGQEAALGKDHYSTLDTIHSIAGLYAGQGLYKEALSLYERVLKGLTDIFGKDHPWTLMTINGMADVLHTLGQYDEALKMYEEIHSVFHKQKRGVRGEFMAASDIGRVKNKQGRYDEALLWYTIAEAGQRKELGEDHVATLSSRFGIASVLENQGQYDKAFSMYQQVQEGMTKALGAQHNMTCMTVCYIAGLLRNKGHYQDALKLYRQAEQGHKQAVGEDHLSTLSALYGMANVLGDLGHYEEAIRLHKRAQDGFERRLGNDHPMTLLVVYGIGSVLEHQKQSDVALKQYKRALDGFKEKLGESHPSTLLAARGMGNVSISKEQYDDALDIYKDVLDGRRNSLGMDHPLTFQVICDIATVLKKKKQYAEALGFYEEALEGLEKAVGSEHPLTLTVVYGKAGVLQKQKRFTEALALYQRTLDGRETALGKLHPETALAKNKKKIVESRQGTRIFGMRRYKGASSL